MQKHIETQNDENNQLQLWVTFSGSIYWNSSHVHVV